MDDTATIFYIKIFGTIVIFCAMYGCAFFFDSNLLLPKNDPLKKWIELATVIFIISLVWIISITRTVFFIDANFSSRYRSWTGGFSVDVPWVWDINTADSEKDSALTGMPERAETHLRAGFRIISRGFEGNGLPRTVCYANMRVGRVGGPARSSSPEELIADLSARLAERKELAAKTNDILRDYAVVLPDMVGDARSTVENVNGRLWAKTTRTADALDGRERTFVYYQTVNPANGALYIVIFSTDHAQQYLPIFRKVIRSFVIM